MEKIYTVTSVSLHDNVLSRMWSIFTEKETAIFFTKHNTDFLSENGYYRYAVVEKYQVNIMPHQIPEEILWYDLIENKEVEKPFSEAITNFAY